MREGGRHDYTARSYPAIQGGLASCESTGDRQWSAEYVQVSWVTVDDGITVTCRQLSMRAPMDGTVGTTLSTVLLNDYKIKLEDMLIGEPPKIPRHTK